jgi:hypothetical protein
VGGVRTRTVWDWKLKLYPIIAALLALVLWMRDANAETISTKLPDGSLKLCEGKLPKYGLLSFCVILKAERGWIWNRR